MRPYVQKREALDADEEAITIDCTEHGTAGIDVRGTFTATLIPEGSIDAGTTWFTVTINPVGGGAGVTSITAAGAWTAAIAGFTNFRVRIDAYTSGTATVNLQSIPAAQMSTNITATVETNFDYLEDAAHVSGDRGAFILAVRNDGNSALSGTDGDYTPISVDSAGNPQVDILTVTPGTGASNLGKAEDAAHASADVGVMVLGVRNDANAALSGTDLDYTPISVDSAGNPQVDIIAALPAGTNNIGDVDVLTVVTGTGATNLGKAEDAGHTTGDTGVFILGVRNDANAALSGTDLDYTPISVDSAGNPQVDIIAALPAGTNNIGDVDVLTVITGTGATNLGKAEDAAHTTGDTGVFVLGVANEAQTTLAADADYIAQATDTKGNTLVVGNIAHDGVDAGNPVKIGGTARQTNPTAVADTDRVNGFFDDVGRVVQMPYQCRDLVVQSGVITLTNTTETTLIAAGAAGVFHDLLSIRLANTSATAVRCDIRDATAGTVIDTFYLPAGDTRGQSFTIPFKQTTAANNWTVQLSASVTDVRITAIAVKNV